MVRQKLWAVLLVVALVGLAACSTSNASGPNPAGTAPSSSAVGSNETGPNATGPNATGPNATGSNAAGSAPQQITIKGSEFKFDPSTITFKANQPVQLVFQNTGKVDHDVDLSAMPATNVQVDLSHAGNIPDTANSTAQQDAQAGKVYLYAAAGKQATVTFTPTTAGAYSFACTVPGHKDAGMVGTATVQ